MGPAISHGAQFRDESSLGVAERLTKDVVPRFPHQFQQGRGIPLLDRLVSAQAVGGQVVLCPLQRFVLVFAMELPRNKLRQPLAKKFKRLADALLVGDGHYSGSPVWSWKIIRQIRSDSPRSITWSGVEPSKASFGVLSHSPT